MGNWLKSKQISRLWWGKAHKPPIFPQKRLIYRWLNPVLLFHSCKFFTCTVELPLQCPFHPLNLVQRFGEPPILISNADSPHYCKLFQQVILCPISGLSCQVAGDGGVVEAKDQAPFFPGWSPDPIAAFLRNEKMPGTPNTETPMACLVWP